MAMSLMWGLIEGNGMKEEEDERVLDCDTIANYYKAWICSKPDKVSDAVKNGLAPLTDASDSSKTIACLAKKAAQEIDPMCNSALSRIAPMAIFASNMTQMEDLKEAVVADVSFTHANTIV